MKVKVAKTPDSFILQIINVFGAHVMCNSKWKWSQFSRIAIMDNGLVFFFERCSLITATACAYELNNAHLFLIFTYLKPFLHRILIIFNY